MSFAAHLDRLTSSRDQALQLIAAYGDEEVLSTATLIALFERLFDHLLHAPPEADDLPHLATIVQRLCASLNHRKSLDLKTRDDARKAEEHEARKHHIRQALRSAENAPTGLDPETRALIEAELQLL